VWLVGGISYILVAGEDPVAIWLPTYGVVGKGYSVAIGAAIRVSANVVGGYVGRSAQRQD
jgi:hypothetical protein